MSVRSFRVEPKIEKDVTSITVHAYKTFTVVMANL